MRILVLNGSPKGDDSITLMTVRYLQRRHPEHTFEILHAAKYIRKIESDFGPTAEQIAGADALLFAYPVYTFLAPSQLHRLIELMKAHRAAVSGKFVTQITTSKHFYDVTAHRFIQENMQDMGARVVRGLSADMEDLLKEKGRAQAEAFWEHFLWSVENGLDEPVRMPLFFEADASISEIPEAPERTEGDVVVVTDLAGNDETLAAMIARFRAVLPRKSRVVNLRDFPFQGGCLGCMSCAADGKCVYRDGFEAFLRSEIQSAEAIVYAFTIRDHSMGSRFKMFDDRQFCNGHRAESAGKPVGYLIDGDYDSEPNLQMVIEGRSQVSGNPLAGVADLTGRADAQIDALAARMTHMLQTGFSQPQNFLGVGGMKIFRDLVYQMRGMMKADHRFYKAHGLYDFPHRKKGTTLLMYLVGALMASPALRAKAGGSMTAGMIAPYRKLLEKTQPESGSE